MKDLKFDIYAMVNPKTDEDYIALLEEAIRMADELNDQLIELEKTLELKIKRS